MTAGAPDDRITVIAADPSTVSLLGLRHTIESSPLMRLVATETNGADALSTIRSDRPRVAILDAYLDDHDGCDIARVVRAESIDTQAIVIAERHTGDLVLQAFVSGAAGFLSKRTPLDAVVDAIVKASTGDPILAPEIGPSLAKVLQNRAESAYPQPTDRELDVLRHLARGHGAVAIAQHLGIATPTVKTHLQNLYLKLGVNDRGAAVAVAIRRGLLT